MDIGADFFIQMIQRTIQYGNLYAKFMNTVLEATQATSDWEDSDEKLNEIHNKISQHWLELYQESVGKYLAAPQFGISREALQQTNMAVASYHKFVGAAGDFFARFSVPLKNSLDILRQAIIDSERTDESFNSPKEIYNFAVNILDKEYDDWLKSSEGVQGVVNIVEKYLEYKQNLNPVRDIWFKSFSIPTNREMEDVYKGIYDLKKKARQQDAIISEQNEIIKTLNQKIRKLETFIPGSSPKKKSSASISAPRKKKTKSSAVKR